MSLERSAGPVQYSLEAPPVGGIEAVKNWAIEMFNRLLDLQQQPRVQSAVFAMARLSTDAPMVRPEDGMLIFAAADVVGAGKPAGLYFYQGGAWKQLTMV